MDKKNLESIKAERKMSYQVPSGSLEPANELMLTRYYRAQQSDSLLKIAFVFNMSVPGLKRLNNLISDDLYPGQILKLNIEPSSPILTNPDFDALLFESELELKKQLGGSVTKSFLKSSFLSGDGAKNRKLTGSDMYKSDPQYFVTPEGKKDTTEGSVDDEGNTSTAAKEEFDRNNSVGTFPQAEDDQQQENAMTHQDMKSQFDNIQSKLLFRNLSY